MSIKDIYNEKILTIKDMIQEAGALRKEDEDVIIGVANGCFDLLHPGHIHILFELANRCHYLFVLVNDDESVRKLEKGGRPIIPIEDRLILLASIEVVDYVASFSSDSPREVIAKIKPDILIKGEDWKDKKLRSSQFAKETFFCNKYKNYSTSNLIRRCHEAFMNKEMGELTQRILKEVEDEDKG